MLKRDNIISEFTSKGTHLSRHEKTQHKEYTSKSHSYLTKKNTAQTLNLTKPLPKLHVVASRLSLLALFQEVHSIANVHTETLAL